jgi:FkbM family methyltransferase
MSILSFISANKDIKYSNVSNKLKPGINFLCTTKQNTTYCISIIGKNKGKSPVLLWIADKNGKRLHYSHGTRLKNTTSEIKVHFFSGSYEKIQLGLLFLNPSDNDLFQVDKFLVDEASNIDNIMCLNFSKLKKNLICENYNQVSKLKSSFFNKLGLKIVHISRSLYLFTQLYDIFSLMKYDPKKHINQSVLFFGMYEDTEYNLLNQHKGDKYVLWGGSDVDMQYVNKIKNMNIIHFSSSLNVHKRLLNKRIESKCFLFWLTDPQLFKITKPEKLNKVYIYSGSCSGNNWKYGKNMYMEVIKRLENYEDIEFILTEKIFPYPYNKMFEIYKNCFVALRLTTKDACAATVQELSLMGIPCIHNCNNYPNTITYKSVDDIVSSIKKCYENRYKYDKNEIRNRTLKLIENNGYTINNNLYNFTYKNTFLQFYYVKDDHISNFWKNNIFYEINLLEKIKSLGLNGTYVDIGSHHGNHSVYFDKFCKSEKVISIEGNPYNFTYLKKNIDINNCKNILYNKIINDKDGDELYMEYNIKNTGCSKVIAKNGDKENKNIIKNTTNTLDNLLKNEDNITFIKMDIENYEYYALLGAKKIIDKFHPVISIELHNTNPYYNEIINFLRIKNYKTNGISYCKSPTFIYTHV